jgi:hypothetical protein
MTHVPCALCGDHAVIRSADGENMCAEHMNEHLAYEETGAIWLDLTACTHIGPGGEGLLAALPGTDLWSCSNCGTTREIA